MKYNNLTINYLYYKVDNFDRICQPHHFDGIPDIKKREIYCYLLWDDITATQQRYVLMIRV